MSNLTMRPCETGCEDYTEHLRTQYGGIYSVWTCQECTDRAMHMEIEKQYYERALREAAKSVGCCAECGCIVEREFCPRCQMMEAV